MPTEIPELLKLLRTPINILRLSGLFKVVTNISVINKVKLIIKKSSWFSLISFLKLKIFNKIKIFIREISKENERLIRALYYPPYYPKIKIGKKTFNIILEE